MTVALLVLVFATSAAGTGLVLWLARRFQLVDVPNPRSAHRRPTPTLGGLGLVAGAGVGLALADGVPADVRLAAGSGLVLLLPTVADDLVRPLTAAQKMAFQGLAVAAWLALGPPLAALEMPGAAVDLGAWGKPLAAAWLLWAMNAFNFMDGVDGITGTQTLAACAASAACLLAAASPLAVLPLLTAAATAGFLVFNAPPARIFMGDIGSLSLGYLVGATALAGQAEGLPVWASLLILGCYVYDTSHTLVRRAARGDNLLRAHQEHLYQRLVQSGWTHGQVDGALLAVAALLGGGAFCLVTGRVPAGAALGAAGAAALTAGAVWKERHRRG